MIPGEISEESAEVVVVSNKPGMGFPSAKTTRPEALMDMKDRTDQELSDPARDRDGAQAGRPASPESPRGGKHEEVQSESLMERILAPENLATAWRRVKANAGAPGIDEMSVAMFPAFCRQHWPRIRSRLIEGTYRPAPVRRVFIPKPDGSQRPLGIPHGAGSIDSASRGPDADAAL